MPEAERLRDSLVRVQQRRQARSLAGWLERLPQLGQEVFARRAPQAAPASSSGEGGDPLDLLLACSDLLDVAQTVESMAVWPYAPLSLDV